MVKSYNILVGICFPRSCSARDIASVINFSIMVNDNIRTNKTTSRVAKITSVRHVPGDYDIGRDDGAIFLICITVILATLALVATVVDLDWIKCFPYGKRSMTFDLEKYHTDTKKNLDRDIKHENIDLKNEVNKLRIDNTDMNYMAVESMIKGAPAITVDVTSLDRSAFSCRRCGKYRKQCNNVHQQNNLPPCPRLQYNSIASLSTETEKRNIFCRLLLCFSIPYCWKRVFNTNTATKDLSLIHGNAADVNDFNNIYYIVATGTIAFDTLFFVSGLFSSHHFFHLKSQYSVEELVGWDGACGQLLQFICFVTNRVIRLVPSYAYAVLLSSIVARWSRSVSTLALPDKDHSNCNDYWWRNILYVSNFFPVKEQCMQISWYLSTETQVHMLGALLCAASVSSKMRARVCVTIALIAALSTTVSDANAAYYEFGKLFSSGFDLYTTIIERPWARVSPYSFGVFTGWLVHILQGKLKVSKITSSLLWISSLSFIFASIAVSMIGLPWLAAWLHLSWPIALLWPVLMGTTNLAGAFRRLLTKSPVAALSRLCYVALLRWNGNINTTSISATVSISRDTILQSTEKNFQLCYVTYFNTTA
ncbi:unnamed protein product [Arctia plantaginis]|uniref:Uncharacterized protein n=1 Tax=Arctia plantaginis TaxID=874455 RepID=A0A8S1BLC2_ARCPL|nr:unnamed protein product [Arctia plantaginis]